MNKLDCQIFQKTRMLIKRKQERLRDFEAIILEDQYMNIMCMIDAQLEDISDLLLFSSVEEYKDYKDYIYEKLDEIEEFKERILNNYESKIYECQEYSDEEAVMELEGFIEDSKVIVSEYFKNFKHSFEQLISKVKLIEQIPIILRKFKSASFNYQNIIRNLKNLQNLITVDNAQSILISNFEKLVQTLEDHFQNLTSLVESLGDTKMEPCMPEEFTRCSAISNSSNDDESLLGDEPEVKESPQTSDCFFLEKPTTSTRIESIERLKTDLIKLDEQVESIEASKNEINQQIELKKKEICEALEKVAEYEAMIEEIESVIEDKLFSFQQRLIQLEMKLQENFQRENDQDLKMLLENEIFEVKNSHQLQNSQDERNLRDLIQQGQFFAMSIGNVLSADIPCNTEKLQQLLNRQSQFCIDSNGKRFYFDMEKRKIYQDENYSCQYIIDENEEVIVLREGYAIQSDENGEFYCDKKERKVYIKYFFEDENGRYYIDVHGDRHYKTDSEASEYMLVNGNWVKTKEGTYERDEKGARIHPISQESSDDFQQGEAGQSDPTASSDDMKYIKETVGKAIIKACSATYLNKPSDPLAYFANFLLHYRYTEKMIEARECELNYFKDLHKKIQNLNEQQ